MKRHKAKILGGLFLVICSGWSMAAEKLPEDLKWESNDNPPLFADPQAKEGGTFHSYLSSYPLTLRNVGPDSNGAFRYFYDQTNVALTSRHPNTDEIYGVLAEKWAYSKDHKAAFYKLRKNAKWSDGKPVTPEDFIYTLEFMRSEHIVAPWYNKYYTDHYDKVVKYDDHTIGIFLHKPSPEIDLYANLGPTPKHFYHPLDKDFVKKYNWKAPVTTGPYKLGKMSKGKFIEIERVKNWWGKDLPIFKHRFNIDKIVLNIVRDENLAFQKFLKGDVDAFALVKPDLWHDKSNTDEFKNGYIHRYWFYTDKPEASMGLEFNMANPILADKNVRLGVAHAVNVELVLNNVLRGDFERQHSVVSGYGEYTDAKLRARVYDLKKANEYFDAAGFKERGPDGIRVKNGQRLSVKVSYSAKEHTPRLVVMKQELKKAGFELNLHLVDGALGFKHNLEKKHEIAYTGWGAMIRPEMYSRFHSSNANKTQTNNFTNIADPELDKALETYRNAEKLSDKIQASHRVQQIIHEYGAIIPLWEAPYLRIGFWGWFRFPKVPFTKTMDVYAFDPLDLLSYSSGGLAWMDQDAKKKVEAAKKKGEKLPVVNEKFETYKKKA